MSQSCLCCSSFIPRLFHYTNMDVFFGLDIEKESVSLLCYTTNNNFIASYSSSSNDHTFISFSILPPSSSSIWRSLS